MTFTREELQANEYRRKGAYHWQERPKEKILPASLRLYERILALVSPPLLSCLDIGCGDGAFTSRLMQKSEATLGVDFDPYALHLAREQEPSLTLVCADAGRLPFENETFSHAFCLETLEHNPLESAQKIVNEAYRILKPGGIFLVSVPSQNIPVSAKHYRHYTQESLLNILEQFETVNSYGMQTAHTGLRGPFLEIFFRHHLQIPLLARRAAATYATHFAFCDPKDALQLLAVAKK